MQYKTLILSKMQISIIIIMLLICLYWNLILIAIKVLKIKGN